MQNRLPLSAGDYLRALDGLRIGDVDTAQLIARLMGFTVAMQRIDPPQEIPVPRAAAERKRELDPDTATQLDTQKAAPEVASDSAVVQTALTEGQTEQAPPDRVLLSYQHQDRSQPPAWTTKVSPLQREAAAARQLPLLSLFTPRWSRALLTAALSKASSHGEVDTRTLLAEIARGQAIMRMPRQRRRALAARVQVLLDRSEAMVPFYADQSALVPQLRRLVGRDRIRTGSFAGVSELSAWQERLCRAAGPAHEILPRPYGVVLLLSDVGIGWPLMAGDRIGDKEWLGFARALHEQGHRLVVLVPYGESRWPQRLRSEMTLLRWDRSTTISRVQRALHGAEPRQRRK